MKTEFRDMEKKEILTRILSIYVEISRMSDDKVQKYIDDNNFFIMFENFYHDEKSKIVTTIQMTKIKIPDSVAQLIEEDSHE